MRMAERGRNHLRQCSVGGGGVVGREGRRSHFRQSSLGGREAGWAGDKEERGSGGCSGSERGSERGSGRSWWSASCETAYSDLEGEGEEDLRLDDEGPENGGGRVSGVLKKWSTLAGEGEGGNEGGVSGSEGLVPPPEALKRPKSAGPTCDFDHSMKKNFSASMLDVYF